MRVLLVEDDPALSAQVTAALEAAGYAVDQAEDGEDGHFQGESGSHDAIILDLGLPILDGLTVLKRWRKAGLTVPILILTARDSWQDKVDGIDAGADDYLAKPFHMEELKARLRALIRRASGHASPSLSCGSVSLDTRSGQVRVAGNLVALTAHEYRLLSFLMHHPGRVLSRSELTEHLYAQDFDRDSNTIEVFVGRLRRKLGVDLIETVRGLGYRLRTPAERQP